MVDGLLYGGQQFCGVVLGEVDVLAAQAGHRRLRAGQGGAQIVADRAQQRPPQLVGLPDGLRLPGLLGEFALPDERRRLPGDHGQDLQVSGRKCASRHQQPELAIFHLDYRIRGFCCGIGLFADPSDDVRLVTTAPKEADGTLGVGLSDPLQQIGEVRTT